MYNRNIKYTIYIKSYFLYENNTSAVLHGLNIEELKSYLFFNYAVHYYYHNAHTNSLQN